MCLNERRPLIDPALIVLFDNAFYTYVYLFTFFKSNVHFKSLDKNCKEQIKAENNINQIFILFLLYNTLKNLCKIFDN